MRFAKLRHHQEVVFSFVALFGLAACSNSTPPPARDASQKDSPKSSHEVAQGELSTGDLPVAGTDSVPTPPSVLAILRMGDPTNDIPGLGRVIQPTGELARAVVENPRRVIRNLLGSLGVYVDVEKPIDMVVFNPEHRLPVAVSFVLADYPRARKHASSDFTFTKSPDGAIVVTPKPGASLTGIIEKAHLACSIYAGTEANETHLVCSEKSESRDTAGRYLAQVVARNPVGPGVHLAINESFMKLVLAKEQTRLAKEATTNSAYDKGQRLGSNLVFRAFDDMRDFSMDLATDTGDVRASLGLDFRSSQSPISVGILGSGKPDRSTPAEFYRIPSDADMAFYFPGAEPKVMRAAAESFWAEAGEVDLNATANSLWKQFIPKLSKMFLRGGPCLMAHGPGVGGTRIPPGLTDRSEIFRLARIGTGGWSLLGAFEPASTWTAGVRDLLKNPTIFAKHSAADLLRTTDDRKSKDLDSTEEVPIAAGDGLPAGSVHIMVTHVPNPAYRGREESALDGTYSRHFFVGGTSSMTWITVSDNETLARSKLVEVLNTGSPGLSSRTDLEPLRSMSSAGMGFATIVGFSSLFADRDTLEQIGTQLRLEKRLYEDFGAQSPIFFSFLSKEGSNGSSLRVNARANDAVVRTLVEFIQARARK